MKPLAILLLSLCASCVTIPPVGTQCDSGVAYCAMSTSALYCKGGVLVSQACTGPKGCTLGAQRAVLCDELFVDGG